uniref:Uncharacterized protein n=1 Tax=Kwoniella bestiolae CBS 10118 TaxID=1296100 RepID=A0A1B9FXP3_9TREE|nr:hypothetical protein I302_06518 [Kwoniella bestiolae CBS 10118]OCF23535.1 hypothetical protein I302_06518 [Kwoniella bestiolae CBS 10118]
MEFIPSSDSQSLSSTHKPKNVYPCLAHIHIIPHSDPKATRRLSTGSFGSDDGGGNALTRVISGGGRRKSTDVTNPPPAGGRRLSFGHKSENTTSGGMAAGAGDGEIQGKWYWRVQAGVTETHLVLLPLTQPPNPVLTTPPAPLSHAMPSHSTQVSAGTRTESGVEEDGGLMGKMKNLFRRSSTVNRDTSETINTDVASSPHAQTGVVDTITSGSAGFGAEGGKGERVIDQTPKGEMLPPAKGNEIGATNLNQNAETGYPGVINGSKLSGVVISLGAIDKSKIVVGGGKKGEGSWITVPVALGDNAQLSKNDSYPKSGYIKFEFDKDWIGAKGECELLHHHLTHAISTLPESKDRQPHLAQFHLGGGGGGGGTKHSPNLPQMREVGPNDESAIEEDDEGPTGISSGRDTLTGTGAGMGTRGAGMGMGGTGGAADTGDIAAGATGDRGIALGHPVAGAGHASEGGSSVSGKVGGE